jgi:hypothetical protein
MLLVLFLFVESVLFGLFTQCMLIDQLSSLRSNQTQIDKLKNQKHVIKVKRTTLLLTLRSTLYRYSYCGLLNDQVVLDKGGMENPPADLDATCEILSRPLIGSLLCINTIHSYCYTFFLSVLTGGYQ